MLNRGLVVLLILLSSSIAVIAPAQNLLDDGQRLLNELKMRQDEDSIHHEAAARQAMLILARYAEPAQAYLEPGRLLQKTQANPLLRDVLPTAIFSVQLDGAELGLDPDWKRIENLMYGGTPPSPKDYWSVQRSLQNSQAPPIPNSAVIRSSAQNAQGARPLSALNVDGVTQKLFEFLLSRAKQEVAVSFFDNLLGKNNPVLDSLFQNVCDRFDNPRDINYSESFLESLRGAFFLDMKKLPLNLSNLLLDPNYFGALERAPSLYNVMSAYSLYGLSRNEAPIWESIPLVHRELYDRYQTAEKKLNIKLSDDSLFEKEEYQQVRDVASEYVKKLDAIVFSLYTIQNSLSDNRQNDSTSLGGNQTNENFPAFAHDPLYDYYVLVGYKEDAPEYHLVLLPELLEGELNDTTTAKHNNIPYYDLFFAKPYSKQELRSAGLELARRLVDGGWYNDLSQVDILRRWRAALTDFKSEIELWKIESNTSIRNQKIEDIENYRAALLSTINSMHEYWKDKNVERVDTQALLMLREVASPPFDLIYGKQDTLAILKEREKFLHDIEQRLMLLERRLASKNWSAAAGSPYQDYLLRERASPDENEVVLNRLIVEIDSLQIIADMLRAALNRLDSAHASVEHRACQGARPMLQATELLSNLFFALYDPETRGLIDPRKFEDMLHDQELRPVCLGLLHQRLSRVKGLSLSSSEALAQYALHTLKDFHTLQNAPEGSSSENRRPDTHKLFHTVSTGLQVLKRTLEFPLFSSSPNTKDLRSLSDLNPALRHVPEISEHCINLLYYLETDQYRPAIGSMIRLFSSLSKQLGDSKSTERRRLKNKEQKSSDESGEPATTRAATKNRKDLLDFFAKYGDFIGGLVEAQSPADVELLMMGITAPPGSSRTKRTHVFSGSLNAYLGLSAGRERWSSSGTMRTDTSYFNVAPNIPIGITGSFQLFRNSNNPQSFSLHLTALDLGAMLTYRQIDEEEFGSHMLSFKNMVRPGVIFHWNVPKIPVYVGLGWQSGAQFREKDEKEIAFRSSRTFVTLGLDMPLLSLFAQKEPHKKERPSRPNAKPKR